MRKKKLRGMLAVILGFVIIGSNASVALAKNGDNLIEISGTYSTGNSKQWQSLDKSYFKDANGEKGDTEIVIDPSVKYQQYQGIGISLDETSVSNLWEMPEDKREEIIKKLVSPTEGAGLDQFRITIGSPDCIEHIPFWSYDELPQGVEEDFDLEYFSIEKDYKYHLVDVAKLILKYNPDAKFFGSAWSAPAWMTTSGTFTGFVEKNPDGSHRQASALRDDCINVFARYYAKFIKAYEAEGIEIDAITLLNEPGMDVVYPAMDISIEQQQKLAIEIKKVFKDENIDTKLWMHDFNFWDWKDPNSTETKNYYRIFEGENGEATYEAADGIGFHPYWGDPEVMLDTYNETGKPVYLTEAGGMGPGTILDYFKLNCSSYTGWTQMTDQNGGTLHWTDSRSENLGDSPDKWYAVGASEGAKWRNRLVTINTDTKDATYSANLYSIGQMSRYLDYGAQRIKSSETIEGITNVVYINKEDNDSKEYVMILNNKGEEKNVDLVLDDKVANVKVPNGFTTYTWEVEDSTEEVTVNKDDLNNTINKAEKIDISKYTDESAAKLKDALNKAKKVLENEESTQTDIDNANNDLLKAIDELKLKDSEAPKEPSTSSPVKTGDVASIGLIALTMLGSGIAIRKLKRK